MLSSNTQGKKFESLPKELLDVILMQLEAPILCHICALVNKLWFNASEAVVAKHFSRKYHCQLLSGSNENELKSNREKYLLNDNIRTLSIDCWRAFNINKLTIQKLGIKTLLLMHDGSLLMNCRCGVINLRFPIKYCDKISPKSCNLEQQKSELMAFENVDLLASNGMAFCGVAHGENESEIIFSSKINSHHVQKLHIAEKISCMAFEGRYLAFGTGNGHVLLYTLFEKGIDGSSYDLLNINLKESVDEIVLTQNAENGFQLIAKSKAHFAFIQQQNDCQPVHLFALATTAPIIICGDRLIRCSDTATLQAAGFTSTGALEVLREERLEKEICFLMSIGDDQFITQDESHEIAIWNASLVKIAQYSGKSKLKLAAIKDGFLVLITENGTFASFLLESQALQKITEFESPIINPQQIHISKSTVLAIKTDAGDLILYKPLPRESASTQRN